MVENCPVVFPTLASHGVNISTPASRRELLQQLHGFPRGISPLSDEFESLLAEIKRATDELSDEAISSFFDFVCNGGVAGSDHERRYTLAAINVPVMIKSRLSIIPLAQLDETMSLHQQAMFCRSPAGGLVFRARPIRIVFKCEHARPMHAFTGIVCAVDGIIGR